MTARRAPLDVVTSRRSAPWFRLPLPISSIVPDRSRQRAARDLISTAVAAFLLNTFDDQRRGRTPPRRRGWRR